jgi:hypothetical protein
MNSENAFLLSKSTLESKSKRQLKTRNATSKCAPPCGLSAAQIVVKLELTSHQVRYTLNTLATSKKGLWKPSCRKPQATPPSSQVCVRSSKKTCRINYKGLAEESCFWGVLVGRAIKSALDKEGFHRG